MFVPHSDLAGSLHSVILGLSGDHAASALGSGGHGEVVSDLHLVRTS